MKEEPTRRRDTGADTEQHGGFRLGRRRVGGPLKTEAAGARELEEEIQGEASGDAEIGAQCGSDSSDVAGHLPVHEREMLAGEALVDHRAVAALEVQLDDDARRG